MILVSPQWALLSGVILALIIPHNELIQTKAKAWSSQLLQLSVILLGASLNFNSVIKQGAQGIGITFLSITFVFIIGLSGKKFFRINSDQSILITMGTAICGGSAIGALAPVIKADSMAIAISMGVVFLLNAIAVFLFPFIGELLSLSQEQFGLWSAIAIHDTSSVVAASSIYGPLSLEIATTVKLTRALWIIPITLIFSFAAKKQGSGKIKFPWFILGFLLLSLTFTFIDFPKDIVIIFKNISKIGFSVTLFLIGLTFSRNKIRQVGARPLVFGFSLWLIVCCVSLWLVKNNSF